MRYLFLSYIFPGPLGAMASWLAAQPERQVIFASTRSRQELPLPNVQRVIVKTYAGKKGQDNSDYFDLLEEAARAGKSARSSLELVRKSGFEPDIIFSASSNGSALGLKQIFPDAFLVNFLEEENFSRNSQSALRQGIQSLQILEANMAYAFSEERKKKYAPELWPKISLAPRLVDTDFFDPARAAPFNFWKSAEKPSAVLTVFAQGLDEIALFKCWNACLEILEKREDAALVLLLDGSYTLRRLKQIKVPEKLEKRLYIEAHLRQDNLRSLLAASQLALFPDARKDQGLLESMSCAVCPMLSGHKYFLKNGWDALDMGPREDMAKTALELLAHPEALREMGKHARETAVANFSAARLMPRFFPQIEQAYREWNGGN